MRQGRLLLLAALSILALAAQPQPPQPGPWSEQPPYPQRPQPPQAPSSADDEGNAPDRGVARISFMNGNVSVRRGDSADMVAAILNAPLTIGDRLVTGDGGRAEVQLDYANLIRLGPSSEVRFSELQRGRYQIQIAAGTTTFRVLRDSDAQVEISTPSMSVRPLKKGIYRVNVKPDGVTEITLRAGAEGEVFGPRGSEQIHNGSTMMIRGSANDPEFQVVAAIPEDEFDHWGASRDQYMERATAPTHVSRDVYGTEDMDQYGRWTTDGSYGQVWVPQASPGWAPYSCGRWTWVDYYGWTWVGCEPWGWAPYHYGRWYYGSLGWAWWPGSIYSPYFWRPALVGFFGWGAPGFGVGFGFGFGHVGWVPLAPFERFRPWYGAGGFRGGAVAANINVTGTFRNARAANGISSMGAGEFGRGSVSPSNMPHATSAELARAGTVSGRLPMTPTSESRQFTNRAASLQGAPRTGENTRFFSNRTSAPSNGSSSNGGWQRITPSNMNRSTQSGSPGASQNGGWQRFDGNSNRGSMSSPQSGARSYSPTGSSQPQVRINPPIVQSRPSSVGNNGGGRPAPSSNARPSGGATRGGGGGGSRSSGGGGAHGGGSGRH